MRLAITILCLVSTPSFGWEKHQAFPWGASPFIREASIAIPCAEEDQTTWNGLVQELELNRQSKLVTTADLIQSGQCGKNVSTSPERILQSAALDEPDFGMDENLPEAADPRGDRAWMGGKAGPTSKGFRHMYFGGIQWRHPLQTFQIPTRPVGQSPDRITKLTMRARGLIASGQKAWGYRVLGWAMHYIQDLSQPFHAVQIPDLGLIPWYALLAWPPDQGFNDLVRESTRVVANYHWAFEDYVLSQIKKQKDSPFEICLEKPQEYSGLEPKTLELASPELLARAVAKDSVQLGPRLGKAVLAFFGRGLKNRGVDLPRGQGTPDYQDYAIRPDLAFERQELHQVSCRALANGALASRQLVQWALKP